MDVSFGLSFRLVGPLLLMMPAVATAEQIGLGLPQQQLVATMSDCSKVNTDLTAMLPTPGQSSGVTYSIPAAGDIVAAKVQLGSGITCEFGEMGALTPIPLALDQYQLGLMRPTGDGAAYDVRGQTAPFTVQPSKVNKIKGLDLAASKGDTLVLNNTNNRNSAPVLALASASNSVLLSEFSRSSFGGSLLFTQTLTGYQIAINAEFTPQILPRFKTPGRARQGSSLLKFGFKQPGSVSRTEFTLYRRRGKRCFPLRSYSVRNKSARFAAKGRGCSLTGKGFKWFKARLRGSKGSFTLKQPPRSGKYFAALRATAKDGYRTKTYETKRNVIKFAVL